MVWQFVAQAAFQIGSSYMQNIADEKLQRGQNALTKAGVYSYNTVNAANTDAANLVRAAGNEFSAAQASLQNALRSIGNREKMYVFGQQHNALEENEGRVMDSIVRGNLSTQLKGAAALGALRAQAAASGTGGSSRDIMRSVSALAQGAAITSAAENQKYVQFDSLLQKAGLLRSAASGIDVGQALPRMDYGVNVAPVAQVPINALDFSATPAVKAVTGWVANGGAAKLLGSFGGKPSPVPNGNIVQSGGGGSLGDFFNGA
jgi:hypothetical protein